MRYSIFFLCILLNSCTLFRHHQPGQEKITTNELVRSTALPATTVDSSKPAIDTIPGAVVFDPSLIVLSESEYSWGYPSYGQFLTVTNFMPFFITGIVTSPVDSTPIQPVEETFDAIPAVPVKYIPKSTAAIFPEPEVSMLPYIACGIAAVFLSTLFYAFLKRARKTK